jgi:Type II CAAX prenyl endopeptidase Rce1-like
VGSILQASVPIAKEVRTSIKSPPERPVRRRRRSRFGYDHHWWGENPVEPPTAARRSYWSVTRRPLPCLAFVAPLLLAYELGVLWLGGPSAEALRTGADAWMRKGLGSLGLTDHWLLPGVLVVMLLVWQAFSRRDWRFHPLSLLGMAFESLVLAVALVGLSKLVDLGFVALERTGSPTLAVTATGSGSWLAPLVGFLGAGVYEEALFRLTLIPLIYMMLRGLQTPRVLASSVAVTASALLFSLAHHAGMPGEAFTWYAFIFRWLAGVYFAWVFVVRGFGVAVGTHTAYDILVGWLGWHF